MYTYYFKVDNILLEILLLDNFCAKNEYVYSFKNKCF